jgi:hypothetical protein
MRVRGVVAGVAVALVGFMVAACETTATGSPTAATTVPDTTGGTPSDPPTSGSAGLAPPVGNPKDLRGVDACELLTPEQLTEFSMTGPGRKNVSEWGEEDCEWVGSIVAIGLSPNATLGDGLDRAYRNKNNFDNFAESNVDGYPAVRINFATQSCGLIAGVSDEQTLNMEFTRVSPEAPGRGDPCAFAESVMGAAIRNLPDA